MAMTRADWDVFQTNRTLVLDLLKSNQGDFFSAKEIAEFLTGDLSCDLNSFQVGKVLSNGYKEGLVSRKYDGSQYTWCITDAGAEWTPQPYDWRHAKGRDKPAPDHPWVATPSVTPKEPDRGTVTRPLPAHLVSKSYADIRLPTTPEEKPMTTAKSTCNNTCANHDQASQETVDQEANRNQVHEAQIAREALIVALLGYGDERLSGDSGWKRLRRVSTYFGLEESYA